MFEFKILAKDPKSKARVGEFETPHGKLLTPEFAFVATEGELKSIPKDILPQLPVNLTIVNTFHLWVKKILSNFKNIHDYANFQKPIMSDSGGFQVFSLGFGKAHGVGKIASIFPDENKKEKGLLVLRDHDNLLHITEEGVMFNYDKKWFMFTPEMSIEIQKQIGSDIIFAFDECTSPLNSYEYTKKALERTHQWLIRCINEYQLHHDRDRVGHILKKQALFGIVQGGYFEDLRKKSAKLVGRQDVPGFGIGGTLGRSKEDMHKVIEWTISYLPDEKPRHLFGIGQVRDIFESVERGVDLFDCVIPTREARHRVLYTKKGRINLEKMKNSPDIIDKDCTCLTCSQSVKFDQLTQLFKLKDPRAFLFATVHNIQFYADLMKKIREAIDLKKFFDLKEKLLKHY